MTISARIVFVVALVAGACSGGSPRGNPLLRGLESPPPAVQQGCELAQVKCTRCHTIERALRARVDNADHWVRYVRRMRLQPGSGIGAADEPRLVRCLVYRSFGAEALSEYERGLSE